MLNEIVDLRRIEYYYFNMSDITPVITSKA